MQKLYLFVPKPDITALELAEALASVLNCQSAAFQAEMLSNMSEQCKRHFVERLTPDREFFLLLGGSNAGQ